MWDGVFLIRGSVNLVMSPLPAWENERRGPEVSKPLKTTKTTSYEHTGNDMLEHYAETAFIK